MKQIIDPRDIFLRGDVVILKVLTREDILDSGQGLFPQDLTAPKHGDKYMELPTILDDDEETKRKEYLLFKQQSKENKRNSLLSLIPSNIGFENLDIMNLGI